MAEAKRWLVELADVDDRHDEWVRWHQLHVSARTPAEAGTSAVAQWRKEDPARRDHRLVVLQAQDVHSRAG